MNRNKLIDFLCDQSIDKDKVLYEMLKEKSEFEEYDSGGYEYECYGDTKPKPQFAKVEKCKKCRYYMSGSCQSLVAKEKGCGEPDYKYFEED